MIQDRLRLFGKKMAVSRHSKQISLLVMLLVLLMSYNPLAMAQLSYTAHTEEGKTLVITAKDIAQPSQAIVLYTPDFGASTRTNGNSVEITATQLKSKKGVNSGEASYIVKSVRSVLDCQIGKSGGKNITNNPCGNSRIPENGIVLSASGDYRKTLLTGFAKDTVFTLTPQWFQTKTYPLTVIDPSPANNPIASGFPGYRGSHQLVVYDKNYGQPQTGTNEFGFEVTVVNGVVVAQEGSNSQIPENGFILSGHGRARDWLIANAPLGAKIELSTPSYLPLPDQTSLQPTAAQMSNPTEVKSTIDLSSYQFQLTRRLNEAPCAVNPSIERACRQTRKEEEQIQALQGQNQMEEAAFIASESLKSLNAALWKQYPGFPETAVKAVWHRPVELSRSAIGETLDHLKAAELNTVFLETYFHGYPIFPSKTYQAYGFPMQYPKFASVSPAFDPLKIWIEEAHKRGMKLHIWFQTFYAGNAQAYGVGPILAKHPDWGNVQYSALQNTSGKLLPSTLESGAYFLDPANPEVKKFLLALIDEVVTRYDIDGLQLDYIRYPASFPPDRFSYLKTTWGYTPYERNVFKSQTGFDPADFTKAGITADQNALWQQWNTYKVMQVSDFVQSASNLIRQKHRNIVISAAVFPALRDSITLKHQDWVGWAQNGWLDMLEPMTLTSAVKVVQADTDRMVRAVNRKIPVISGVFGPFNGNSAETLLQQIDAARTAGASGFSIFDSAHLTGRMVKALDASEGDPNRNMQATINVPLPK